MNYQNEESLDNQVLFILNMHFGRENAIKRWDLVERVYGRPAAAQRSDENPWDRNVRQSIERLRNSGQHICNRGNGNGYYMAESRDEYEEWKKYFLGAAYNKLVTISALDESADQRWGRVPKPHPYQEPLFNLEGEGNG